MTTLLALGLLTACTGPDARTDTDGNPPVHTPPTGPATMPTPVIGTLQSMPRWSAEESRAGVSTAMVEFEWRLAEPERGRFDQRYLSDMASTVQELRRTGRTITLGLGLHSPPGWAYAMPNSRLVNQYGDTSEDLNLVFNQPLRDAAAEYVQAVDEHVDLRDVWAVRLTAGGNAELVYPSDGTYWAFDEGARTGHGLPPTLSPDPLPPWTGPTTTAPQPQVRAWADWYLGALVDVVEWQRRLLRSLGFTGFEQVLSPGVGVRPPDFERIVAGGLPRSLLGTGAAWDRIYAALRPSARLVAYSTSVADDSGGNDVCASGDATVPLDRAGAEEWSAIRWLRRIADEHGLLAGGENPGFGMPARLNAQYVDPGPQGMMQTAFRQAVDCRLQSFYWAHDHDLWNGTADGTAFLELASSRPVDHPPS